MLRRRTLLEIALANIVEIVVAAIGITLVGYLLYASTFVGTTADVVKVFLWAFGLNVTTSAFVDVAKTVK